MKQHYIIYKRLNLLRRLLNQFFHKSNCSVLLMLILISISSMAQVTINPTISSAIIKNPERGFHNYTTLTTTLAEHQADVAAGSTLALLVLNDLGPFKTGPISAAYLDKLKTKFGHARTAKLKFIIIPSYHAVADFNSDPAMNIIKNHITQLAAVFNANKDVIYAIHAGFVGAWGEWYYTQYNIAQRGEIFMDILNKTDPKIKVSIRTPGYKVNIFDMTAPGVAQINPTQAKRVGHFNDCFLADATDMGTGSDFPLAGDWRDFIGAEAKNIPVTVGGEACQVSTFTACANATQQMAKQGWSYINLDYNLDVIQQWKNGGCYNTISQKLGYRLAVKSATYPATVKKTATMQLKFSIQNTGYAPMIHQRPFKVVLFNGTATHIFNTTQNPITWKPGTTTSMTLNINLASVTVTPGIYNLAIYMPDSSATLANMPAFAVQLANTGAWNATKGWNVLKNGTTAVTVNVTN